MIQIMHFPSKGLFAICGNGPDGRSHNVYHNEEGVITLLEIDGRVQKIPTCTAGVYAIQQDLGVASGAYSVARR